MSGLTLCRRTRRSRLYLAVLADLAGMRPAPHLKPITLAQVYDSETSRRDRHLAASSQFRRTGDTAS